MDAPAPGGPVVEWLAAQPSSGADPISVRTGGIDFAEHVFQVHGVDDTGRQVFKERLRRADLQAYFAGFTPYLIGMEVCASA